MGKCVIFCAGCVELAPEEIGPEDLVIAADGGLKSTQKLGITPNVILGDFDSLGYIPAGAQVHPVEKDDTDAMLAVRLGLSRGYETFYLYGAMDGSRADHTLANFQLLFFLQKRGAKGYLIGKTQIATVLWGQTCFPQEAKGLLSLFALGANARVSLQGLQYELEDGLLQPDFPLGVSNHFTGRQACVFVKEGAVLAIYDRENGILEENP